MIAPKTFTPKIIYAMTHAQIGEQIGMTHQGVFYVEKRALKKCRLICERRGITFVDLIDRIKISGRQSAE